MQGDADPVPADALFSGGEIRVWRGGKRGPGARPLTINQDSEFVDGTDDQGDEFGGALDAGDVDDDGYADMIVGAGRGERGGRGDSYPRRARRSRGRQQRVREVPAPHAQMRRPVIFSAGRSRW